MSKHDINWSMESKKWSLQVLRCRFHDARFVSEKIISVFENSLCDLSSTIVSSAVGRRASKRKVNRELHAVSLGQEIDSCKPCGKFSGHLINNQFSPTFFAN